MADRKVLIAFGQRVKIIRKAAHISQEKLAEATDVHPTYISMIESGKTNPTLDIIHKIALSLHADLSSLLSDLQSTTDQATAAKFATIVMKFKRLKPRDQMRIIDAMDILLS